MMIRLNLSVRWAPMACLPRPTSVLARLASRCLAFGLAAACMFANANAAAHEFEPNYRKHDAEAPPPPAEYPARSYTADTLLNRLVEIANGPELGRAELEREFGLHFVKLFDAPRFRGIARGRHPLGNALSTYSEYNEPQGRSVIIFLDLRDRTLRPDSSVRWSRPKLCLEETELLAQLGDGWRRELESVPHGVRIRHWREAAGRRRTLTLDPDPVRQDKCLRTFWLMYDIATTQPDTPPVRKE